MDDMEQDHTIESLFKELDVIEEKNVQQLKQISEAEKLFFIDVHINCSKFILPGNKYVLSARSDILREQFQSGLNELDWTDYEAEVGLALLKWMYTDTVDLENDKIALGLLRASHHFHLHTLFEACECKLLKSVTEERAHEFHCVAEEVSANKLAEECMRLRPIRCHDSPTTIVKRDLSDGPFDVLASLAEEKPIRKMEQEIFDRLKIVAARQAKVSKLSLGVLEYLKCCDIKPKGSEDYELHSYVLIVRSEMSREEMLSNKDLSWHKYSKDTLRALIRWLYTDVISLNNERNGLELIKIAHEYKLSSLFELCEQMLIKTVDINSCAQIHRLAKDVGAVTLLKHCTFVVCAYWEGSQSQDLKKLPENVIDCEKRMSGVSEGSTTEMMACQRELSSLETPQGLLTLNDDCLFHVFRYMSLVDLGSLKVTCLRLNQLVDRHFKIYKQKSLTINSCCIIADLWNLKHFGKFINSLTICGFYPDYASFENIFTMIGKFCSVNIKTISFDLRCEDISDESFKCLEKIMKNVEVINLDGFADDRQINLLLSYCENLKEVCLEGDQMEVNTIWCTKNCNVRRITLNGLINDDILEKITRTMPNLEYLHLNFFDETDTRNINHLLRLNHLKHLHIGCHYENIGNFLQNLSKKNLLEHLSLPYFDNESVKSVAYAIGHFTKLKELCFSQLYYRIDENLLHILSKHLHNIEKLSFVECEEITFEDVTKIIKNNLKLKELVIDDCENIDFIDKDNYLRIKKLRKRRNLQIFVSQLVYENSIKLIADDLSQYVQLVVDPSL